MKKLILLCLMLLLLSGCTQAPENDKIKVTATLFPQYDFVLKIGGDKVDASLLLPAGQESHLYDPSPRDMANIAGSDIFIFTGEAMEGWAADIADAVGERVLIVDASRGAHFIEGDEHDHGHDHDHEETSDPHIWLDFDNAKIMCENIAEALIKVSPENREYFESNLRAYEEELDALDESFRETLKNQTKALVFGGRFALGYLTARYDIEYISAYASCGAEAEPSAKDILTITNYVNENDIKAVYCEEFSDPKVARTIAGESAEVLVLHSAHNTSLSEREEGATFISIMRQNLENIKKGL